MRRLLCGGLLLTVGLLCCSLALPAVSAAPASPASSSSGPTYYDLLGVTPEAAKDPSTLKRSYRKLALQHHPDKATSEADRAAKQDLFTALAHAYEVLTDPRMKARYDFLVKHEGQTEYKDDRDWGDFDVSQGFKRTAKSRAHKQAQKEAEARHKEAYETFKRAQEEAEEFALWTSLSVALVVSLLPAGYMYYRRTAEVKEEEGKKKARSSDLKATQQALLEIQAEQERQRKLQREEELAYQRQLRKERAEAEAAEAAAAASSSSSAGRASTPSSEESGWEVVGEEGAEGSKAVDSDEEQADRKKAGGASTLLKCVTCNKKFKSQQQLENHEQSNQHKKAVKEAERAKKKASKE